MQKTFRRFLGVLGLLALVGIPLASRGADTAPFEINTMLSMTGPAAFVGARTAKAFGAIEAYVNKHGGINGRPVKIVIEDDQTNPQVAVQIMNQLLVKKPSLIIGGLFAAVCRASMPLIKENGPVLYCFSPAIHPPVGSYIYIGGYNPIDLFAVAIRYFRMKGYTKIAMLTSTDATGQDVDVTIPELLARPENRDVVITAKEHFGIGDLSVAAQLERMKASGAQAMIAWASGTPFATVLRGLRDTGVTVPVLASQANLNYAQLESYKSIWPTATPILLNGLPPLTPESIPDRNVRRAIANYLAAMKDAGIDRPDNAEAIVWDPINIFVEAYRRLGTDATPAQLRDYVNGVRNWAGLYGKLDFKASPQRGVQSDWINLIRWDPATAKFIAVSKFGGAPL